MITSESLLLRTAKAMYRVDPAVRNRVDFGSLSLADQSRYQILARAALAVGLAEPVTEVELIEA